LERIAGFLQDVDSIYDIVWAVEPDVDSENGGRKVTYGEMRLAEEEQFSAYSFDYADVGSLWKHLELYEAECLALLSKWAPLRSKWAFAKVDDAAQPEAKLGAERQDIAYLKIKRFPTLGA